MKLCALFLLAFAGCAFAQQAESYDIVIANGRVMDPDSGVDAIRNVGIRNGRIAAVSASALKGRETLDAKGLVVAPGFIDPHAHGQRPENYRLQALDGVTTTLELEVGASPVSDWYAARAGKALINYGASAGHLKARMRVMQDSGAFVPQDKAMGAATAEQQREVLAVMRRDLSDGALGIGMGIAYIPGSTRPEILDVFQLAGAERIPCFVHMRYAGVKEPGAVAALQEVLADALATSARLHVVHLTSTCLRATPDCLRLIEGAKQSGLDVTTEVYPYTAGMTSLQSAIFDPGWQESLGATYGDLQWVETGERLTAETFEKYRKQGGYVAVHSTPEEMVKLALTRPLVMIGSDSLLENGKGHPRSSGTHARLLARYVREQKALSLMEAIRKMTIMPARLLEPCAPEMAKKGRMAVGADADIAVFDASTVADRATFDHPAEPSTGFKYVLVGGVPVVKNGMVVEGALPGKAVRGRKN